MRYVGIDLAWGERQRTGLAVLDASGRLVHVSTVRTDEEIVAALTAYVDGDCLAGVDAPLVVTNPTGSRPAEKALSKDFRQFEAGAHPSNTGKREVADGSRGARVCKALGLDMNPLSGRPRRAIEVYPHPATIVLFGLARTLKYKHKQGRDLELLRSELLVLMGHVETIVTTDVTWAGLRQQVETATRKSQLRVVEDQVDAVVCAYVALFADRWPERTTTYGDFATGYIVTPTLDPALDPTVDPALDPPGGTDLPAHPDGVRAAVQEYAAQQPALIDAGAQFVAQVTAILDEAGIDYLSVSGRTKGVTSFAEKAARTIDGQPAYPDPLRDITDQIGVRVITYVHSDVSAVADLLGDQVLVTDDRDLGQETASEGRFGYASRHLLVELEDGRIASVQLRTVLQHAWAEFEHDIRYKGNVPEEHARDLDRRFTLAAGLLELADQEFATIRERLRPGVPELRSDAEPDDPRIDPRELAAFLAGQYADAGWSRTDHYAWISGLLLELGLTSLDELGDVLRSGAEDLNARMDYRFPPGAVRRLDDALLAAYADRYVVLHGNAHRREALRARLEKLTGD